MKIYFDMDGVLADFGKGVETLCRMPVPDPSGKDKIAGKAMWDAIRSVEHFYDRLDPVPGMPELFMELYRKYGKDCQILTGIPKPDKGITTAAEDKIGWVRRVLGQEVTVNVVIREDKKKYCRGGESVLIDDLTSTIREWEAHGGIGIHFRDMENTRARLRELGIL